MPETIAADPCDGCDGTAYTPDDPFVEVRPARPSDPTDLACVLIGHRKCFPGSRTPAEWDAYIESPEARAAGHLFLT